jgi:integrase
MQTKPNHGPHRTDRARGGRKRVAPGVFIRSDRYLIGFTDASGIDRIKTLGWIKSDARPDGYTLTQAKAERERLRVDVRAGSSVTPTRATFSEVADDFLELFESLVTAGERSEQTLDLYRSRIERYLRPRLGRLPIQQVRAQHIASLLAELRASGKAAWTVKGVYTLIGGVFNHALARGLVSESPLKRLSRAERPRVRNASKPRVLTHHELSRLLAHTSDTYRPIVATALFSGMRLSELLGLRWLDIDFDAGLIRVRHQLSKATSARPARLLPLKTDAAARDVVMSPQLADLLRAHKADRFRRGFARPEDPVFTTQSGTPFYGRNRQHPRAR